MIFKCFDKYDFDFDNSKKMEIAREIVEFISDNRELLEFGKYDYLAISLLDKDSTYTNNCSEVFIYDTNETYVDIFDSDKVKTLKIAKFEGIEVKLEFDLITSQFSRSNFVKNALATLIVFALDLHFENECGGILKVLVDKKNFLKDD